MKKVRKLYGSPNGDRWNLIRDATGEVIIRHEANLASGGHVTHIEIGTFLSSGEAQSTRSCYASSKHWSRIIPLLREGDHSNRAYDQSGSRPAFLSVQANAIGDSVSGLAVEGHTS